MELTKSDNDYINLVLTAIKSNNPLSGLSKKNRESLNEMIKYLSRLNRQNLIDDKQFSELISLACANFIENEVELRIEKSINNKFMYFLRKV